MKTTLFAGVSPQVTAQAKSARVSGQMPISDKLSIHFAGVSAPSDPLAAFKTGGVVVSGGGGTMGSGIALNLMNAGIPVNLHDAKEEFVLNGATRIQGELIEAVKRGIITDEEGRKTLKLLKGAFINETITDIPKDSAMVIEAIFENADAKKALFQKLDAHLNPEAILATNTSSLSVDELAASTSRPDRFIGLHFFFPAHKNRFIEIIPGKATSPETIAKAKAMVRAMGKTPILCQDSPGFVVNRMLVPTMNEGIKLWEREVSKALTAYAQQHGKPADAKAKALIEKQYATTIEQALKETLWPTYSKNPKTAGLLLGAFSSLNMPEYMGLIGDIAKIIQNGLGDAYAASPTVLEKSRAFKALDRKAPDYQQRLDALKYQLGGPDDILNDKLESYKNYFKGLIIGVATQLVDEGVTSPEDLNRGMMVATRWEISPFEMINQLGARKALDLVRQYKATNPEFHVAEVLKKHALLGTSFPLNYVETRKEGSVQTITINKPQRNNAVDMKLLNDFEAAFQAAEKDPGVKTIIFESVGGKHFVSGADIFAFQDEVKAKTAEIAGKQGRFRSRLPRMFRKQVDQGQLYVKTVRPFLSKGYEVFNQIAESKKVTIAKVNGTALGGGSELALAADYIVASDEATFGLPEVKYGIYPAWGGTERLAKRVGRAMATFLILEGSLMDGKGKGPAILNADEAKQIGLVDQLTDGPNLDQAVRDGLASGAFATKPKRESVKFIEGAGLSEFYARNLTSKTLIAKWNRYKTASFDDLFNNELKPLYDESEKAKRVYKRVAKLAYDRVQRGHAPNRLMQEKELLTMVNNMQAMQRLK